MRRRLAGLRHAVVLAAGLALAGTTVAGCTTGGSTSPPTASPSYVPRPDADLYADIAGLEGVTAVRIDYRDDINGRQYLGDIFVADGTSVAAATTLLDRANAILWQGRPNAVLTVSVVSGTPQAVHPIAEQSALGLSQSGPSWLAAARQRYGPQPGPGVPPSVAPTP